MATEEETIPFVGWKHDNRWPRIHRPMDSISSGAKIPARRSGTWSKKKKKKIETKASVSAKQAVTENGRYELINCVGSRGLSFIEIHPFALPPPPLFSSPNSAFIIFLPPCSLPLSLCSVPFLSFSLSHALPFILFLFHSRKDRFCFN